MCRTAGKSSARSELSGTIAASVSFYVENAGDFAVPFDAVESVHSGKVILNCAKLDQRLRRAIGHAHDAEEPGL
jgi:hypothetical protein